VVKLLLVNTSVEGLVMPILLPSNTLFIGVALHLCPVIGWINTPVFWLIGMPEYTAFPAIIPAFEKVYAPKLLMTDPV
jgi:hypothetical protein